MNFTDEEQILPESLTGKKDMISRKMTETRNEIEKMGCPFTRRTSVNKRQRRNPRKWIRALKFMLNIPLARESVRQAHTLFFVIRG